MLLIEAEVGKYTLRFGDKRNNILGATFELCENNCCIQGLWIHNFESRELIYEVLIKGDLESIKKLLTTKIISGRSWNRFCYLLGLEVLRIEYDIKSMVSTISKLQKDERSLMSFLPNEICFKILDYTNKPLHL